MSLYDNFNKNLYRLKNSVKPETIISVSDLINSFEGLNTEFDPTQIQTGNTVGKLNLVDGHLQSNNFIPGASGAGWRLDAAGNLEATSGTFRGALAATSGTIGNWTIGASTISSATSGERLVLDQGNTRLSMINSSENTVMRFQYGSGTTQAYQLIHIQNDARRGIEFIVGSTLGGSAKCITIDNPSTSICLDIVNGGSTALNIQGSSLSAINISHGGTAPALVVAGAGSAAAIDVTGGSYPAIKITQNGVSSNSHGIQIDQSTVALNNGIFITNNANSHVSKALRIDRNGSANNQIVSAIHIESSNTGIGGKATGIDFRAATIQSIFNVAADTAAVGAYAGRIPIYVNGALKYLAYY